MIEITDIFIESRLAPEEIWRRLQALDGDWRVRRMARQYPPEIAFALTRKGFGGITIPGWIKPAGDGSVVRMGTAPGLFGALVATALFAAVILFVLPQHLDAVRGNPATSAAALAVVFALNWMKSRRGAARHAEGIALLRSVLEEK